MKFKISASNSKSNLLNNNKTVNLNQQNFGLGVSLGGTYLSKQTGDPLMSAYATNASDLIRGFKSSQSIPIVKNSASSQ